MGAFKRVIGYGGGGKGGGSSSGANIAPDTLSSRAYAQVLDLISEGEVEGLANGLQSVYLDGTPLKNADGTYNFSGLSIGGVYGTPDQSYIPGFTDVENDVQVEVEVRQDTPIVRTISSPDVDAVRVVLTFPTLSQTSLKDGSVTGTEVDLAIDVQSYGGDWVEYIYDTVNGKASQQYQRSYRIDLPQGKEPWNVRVRRLTPDSTKQNVVDRFLWDSYVEIEDVKLSYPNSALVGIRVDAAQFQSVPTRAYDMLLLRIRVPSNYDPINRTYSGVWDGTFKVAWSNNPAWCWYDMLTQGRYGLGQFINLSQVDKWALYQIAQYCDQLVPDGFGGWEPRFTCNLYLQSQAEAFQVVQDMASIFRGMAYWGAGSVTAVQDAPKDPVALFSQANVADGNFSYTGSSLKARHTVALVTWNNPADMCRPYVEYVPDEDGIKRWGIVDTAVTALGCTSRGQAHRLGRWLLYSERLETEAVTFKAGLDATPVRPGDIIKVADTVRAGQRLGGRISSAATGWVAMDAALVDGNGNPVNAIGATLSVVAMDGSVQTRTVYNQNGATLYMAPDLPSPPAPGAMWIVELPTVQAQLFRVVQVTEADPGQYDITALAHNPSKYNYIDENLALEFRPVTSLAAVLPPPTSITIAQSLYAYQSSVFVQATFSWPSQEGAIGYKVGYSVNGGNFTFASAGQAELDIMQASAGSYTVRVWTVGPTGTQSAQYTEASAYLPGMNQPPGDVQGFAAELQPSDVLLTWAANTDLNLSGYEVRQGVAWDSAKVLVQNFQGTRLPVTVTQAGTATFLCRALNTSGIYSPNVATAIIPLVEPGPVQQFDVLQSGSRLQFTWNANPEPNVSLYEIREGASWGASLLVTQVSGTSFNMPAGAGAAARVFWICAIAAPGLYSSTPEFSTTAVAIPSDRNLVMVQDEAATGFTGTKINCAVTADGTLEMVSGAQRAEYLFDVVIPEPMTTAVSNSLYASMDVLQDDRTTWATALFGWGDPATNRGWQPKGNFQSVGFKYQMALPVGLAAGDIDGFRLDGSLAPIGTSTVSVQQGVSYAPGRYGQGLQVNDTTRVKYTINQATPDKFSLTLWWKPNQVTDCVIATVNCAGGHDLELGYLARTQALYLADQAGRVVTLPFIFAANDMVCLGVAQNSTTRKLFASEMAGTPQMASEEYAPVGTLTELQLY